MNDSVEWFGDNQQVVLQTYQGKTSWNDFLNVARRSAELLNSVDHPVQLIIDRSNAVFFRINTDHMRQIDAIVPANQDLVIVIHGGVYVEIMSKELGPMVAPRAFRGTIYVETMAEAMEVLKESRGIEIELNDSVY